MLCYIDLVGRNAIADQDSVRLSIPTVSDQFLRLLTSGGPTHLSPTAPSRACATRRSPPYVMRQWPFKFKQP